MAAHGTMMAEAQEKNQTYLEKKRKGKFNGFKFHLLRTNQPSPKKINTIIFSDHGPISIFLAEMSNNGRSKEEQNV